MKRNVSGPLTAHSHTPFALKLTVSALAAAGLVSSASVWGQTADKPAEEVAVVAVTGVRAAAQSAQTIKRNAEQVLDSIVADDIGKFPDKNVAEILGRVTGVQVIRQNGEAGNVVIRGLGGVVTLLNGREMFTAAGRSLFLADVPVAMLQRVDVYKSQGSDMVEGGTAGVIDVRTNRPFDFKGQQTAFNGRVENRDKAGSYDPNVSGMVSNRWKTSAGEFGALAGVSYQRGRYHDETAWVSPPMTIGNGVISADSMGRVMGKGDRKRWAGNVAFQYRPSSTLEFYADGFATKIDHDSESTFFVGVLPNMDPASTIVTRSGTKYLDSISNPNSNMFALSSTQARRDDSEGAQGAIGLRWDASDRLRVTSEFVRTVSNYKQENPILDVYTFPKALSASIRDGGGYLNFPGTDMTDPKIWNVLALFDNHNHSEGRASDWRADATYDLESSSFFKELSGGVRVAKRFASFIREKDGRTEAPGIFSPNAIKASSITGMSCVTDPTAGDYGMSVFYKPCANYLLDNTTAIRTIVTGKSTPSPDDPLTFFSDRETTTAFYGKAKFGFEAGSIPVDGNIGVRTVRTQQDVSGYSSNNGVLSFVNIKTANTDVLPSLNMRAFFRPDLIGRLVAGKAIERAAFGDFNPGLVLRPSSVTLQSTGSAGNPYLKPQEGRNLDVALEYYFAPAGSVTGALFRRDFKNFIRRKAAPETYNGVTYQVDRPYNTTKGNLQGFELAYQQFYDKLPGWMRGLGLQANVTYMDGGLSEPDGTTNTFAGMSKVSYNLVGLYEQGPWSARLAYSWRDKFIAEYNYRATGYDLTVDPLKTLDASLSYKISKNLTVTLDGNNLLDTPYHDYHGVPELPRDVRRYDRAIGLSLRWRN